MAAPASGNITYHAPSVPNSSKRPIVCRTQMAASGRQARPSTRRRSQRLFFMPEILSAAGGARIGREREIGLCPEV